MVFNIPFTYVGWLFSGAEIVYLIVNGVLLIAYELIWNIMRNKNNLVKAIPSAMFVFSGIMILNIPLIKDTEMIEYNVKNSDNIISVAILRNGEITL